MTSDYNICTYIYWWLNNPQLLGGKPGTDLLLKTPRQPGLEESPGGTHSKLGGYVLTSTPGLDELLDSPAQR